MKERVFVGLSGGVDSAVSAALLKKDGYAVTGVFIRIALPGYPCSAGEDRREALRVAAHLQIPFLDIDLSQEYQEVVFKVSLDAYRRGETPNPDALCNREIKFGLLYDFAMACGADFLATGHYARVKRTDTTALLAGKDPEKDQSYFLWAIPEERLAKTLFPVGGRYKKDVRMLAKKLKLPNADRKDSQGLCFLGDISIKDALVRELTPTPGRVLSMAGAVIGEHHGSALYTIGERHGFTAPAHRTDEEPLYVIGRDSNANTITVAPKNAVQTNPQFMRIVLREENWIGSAVSGGYSGRFRYRQKLFPARLSRSGKETLVEIRTEEPVPIGQSLVLYDGKRCLGGGVIAAI